MWVTSLQQVRERYFELFFYTHQLYVVFIVFFAMHVGDFVFSYVAGAVFLFLLDRFLRFCQSRATVSVISASCLPCGTVELVFHKPPSITSLSLSLSLSLSICISYPILSICLAIPLNSLSQLIPCLSLSILPNYIHFTEIHLYVNICPSMYVFFIHYKLSLSILLYSLSVYTSIYTS